jgi:hypothetical protein
MTTQTPQKTEMENVNHERAVGTSLVTPLHSYVLYPSR